MKHMDISVTDFLKQSIKAAEHFGFRSESVWRERPECKNCKVSLGKPAKVEERKLDGIGGLLTSGFNTYISGRLNALSEPIFFYNIEQMPRTGEASIVLQVLGVNKSIAEAILIQTIRSLLTDIGLPNHLVRINSLGDRDSQTRYTRELTSFLRKRLEEMPPSAREIFKENAVLALTHLLDKEEDLAYRSPNPMEHLSDVSRRHFREIVEFLDMSDTPYEIDPKLIGHYQCYNDAIFSFDLHDESGTKLIDQPLTARGGRYGNFFERQIKGGISAVGAVVTLNRKRPPARLPRANIGRANIHLVHLGFAPKVRSLLILDQLRQAGILAEQDLSSDSLSAQLRRAEEKGTKYTIIIGQKEYVENTVILRDMIGKNQEIVPMSSLISRLRKAHV